MKAGNAPGSSLFPWLMLLWLVSLVVTVLALLFRGRAMNRELAESRQRQDAGPGGEGEVGTRPSFSGRQLLWWAALTMAAFLGLERLILRLPLHPFPVLAVLVLGVPSAGMLLGLLVPRLDLLTLGIGLAAGFVGSFATWAALALVAEAWQRGEVWRAVGVAFAGLLPLLALGVGSILTAGWAATLLYTRET